MRTIDGQECEIRERTFPGMISEPQTALEIHFEDGDVAPITLNNDSLYMFCQADREALVEYMDEVADMNEDQSKSWAQ